jgi:hypothetical protein
MSYNTTSQPLKHVCNGFGGILVCVDASAVVRTDRDKTSEMARHFSMSFGGSRLWIFRALHKKSNSFTDSDMYNMKSICDYVSIDGFSESPSFAGGDFSRGEHNRPMLVCGGRRRNAPNSGRIGAGIWRRPWPSVADLAGRRRGPGSFPRLALG